MIINVPIGDIVIELGSPDPNSGKFLCGRIIGGTLRDNYSCGDEGLDDLFNAAMDALESILLAHACAGIDVSSEAYVDGLGTAIEACANNFS